jgi:hypothetical protein
MVNRFSGMESAPGILPRRNPSMVAPARLSG